MCRGCYDEFYENRQPPEPTAAMLELAERIAQENYEDDKLSYGALHIVIADWNLESESLTWCLDEQTFHKVTQLEREIGAAMLELTEDQRYVVMEKAERRETELYQARHSSTTRAALSRFAESCSHGRAATRYPRRSDERHPENPGDTHQGRRRQLG